MILLPKLQLIPHPHPPNPYTSPQPQLKLLTKRITKIKEIHPLLYHALFILVEGGLLGGNEILWSLIGLVELEI